MYYKDENGIKRIIKRLEKMPGINDKNREYWKKRTQHWHKTKLFYDHEIKTGVCYFCDREGRAQGSKSTALHHVIYNNDNPLEWTIEVCVKCHSKVDPLNLRQIQRSSAKRYFARSVDKEAERIAINNMSHEEKMRKYVRGYDEAFPKRKEEKKTSSYNRYM